MRVKGRMTNRQRARLGGLARAQAHSMRELAERGAAGLLKKFEREVVPESLLTPEERTARALLARRGHFQRLAIRSAAVRSHRREVRANRAVRTHTEEVPTDGTEDSA